MLKIDDWDAKLKKGEEVSGTYSYISEEILSDIYSLSIMILNYYDQIFLSDAVFTILKEILINANKANAKRLFFQRLGLDIKNPKHYQEGMIRFSDEVTMKWNEQEGYLSNSTFFVKISSKIEKGTWTISVENNTNVLPEEQERIQKRITAAQRYNDLSDAFMDMADSTESAGLGLILTQILLKNSGIGSDNFKMFFNPTSTMVQLKVTENVIPTTFHSKFNDQVLNEIENIPAIPQSLNKLITLCNNPDSNINLISAEIEKDPALSADLLKLSNSSFFITRNKAKTVLEAVKIVGLKNIRNMLYVSGVNKIMNSKYGKAQQIWDHSAKCSFVAKTIAVDFSKPRLSDLAATGGLLHDIGKLVLLTLDKQVMSKMEQLKINQNNSILIEEMSVGISHAEIGARLLRTWKFPEELINIVQYHHKPLLAPMDYMELVEIVYLANMFLDIMDGKSSFYMINQNILKNFKLNNIDTFTKYKEKLSNSYKTFSVDGK